MSAVVSGRWYTVEQAAAEMGMQARYVRLLAGRMGLGEMLHPRMRVLSRADLRKIQAARRPVGRPKSNGV